MNVSRKRKVSINTNNNIEWLNRVFSVNQLMFAILQYIEFPACLIYAAVHSTFRQRLWPVPILPDIIKITDWHSNKQRLEMIKRRKQQFLSHTPVVANLHISVTSSLALFASHVRRAIFHKFPGRLEPRIRTLKQLFATYPLIETVEFTNNKMYKVDRSIVLSQLLQCWRTTTTNKRHLILTDYHTMPCDKWLPMSGINALTICAAQTYNWNATYLILEQPNIQFCLSQLERLIFKFAGYNMYVNDFNKWMRALYSSSHSAQPRLHHLQVYLSDMSIDRWNSTDTRQMNEQILLDLKEFPSLKTFILQMSTEYYGGGRKAKNPLLELSVISCPTSLEQLHYSKSVIGLNSKTKQLLNVSDITIVEL